MTYTRTGEMTPATLFALIDCNNFFVSCERIFRPDLEGEPVVVLSSNDGCVVARSNEAKRLGIPMGAPAFKWRELFKTHRVTQFSANFELYSDISRRITSILTGITPRTEIYSIDESFLDLSALAIQDYTAWGEEVRRHIFQAVGVPVSVGIAPTKTLAKLGADYAKQDEALRGVLSFVDLSRAQQQTYLTNVALEHIWGIGWRLGPKLHAEGIHNAWDVSRLPPRLARQLMGLPGMQVVHELNGQSCHTLTAFERAPKSIMRSRTFGEDTYELQALEAAVANLTAQAALQARSANLLAKRAVLFVSTSRHKPGYRSWHELLTLPMPTNDSGHIVSALAQHLRTIYGPQHAYHRAGITLYDFLPVRALQTDMLGMVRPERHDTSQSRMQAIDAINARFGRGRVHYATEALSTAWRPKHSLRSPRYVSLWAELPEAKIG